MTHQNIADDAALARLLDHQIPRDEQIDVIDCDGAYDTKPCHAAIAACSAVLLQFRHAKVPLIGQWIARYGVA
ncbi:MAG: hypothetical protein E5299_01234 [Burkholderia gladioli]|nr:MAG: hypothetical protein E5299_01234 [Burkholderia gladioli]